MKKSDYFKLSMWEAIYLLLAGNSSIWSHHEPFTEAMNALSRIIAEAREASRRQALKSVGVTSRREAMEEEAIGQVLSLAGMARAFAIQTGNLELFHAINYPRSEMARGPQSALIDTLTGIIDAISPYAEALLRYGVTAEACEKTRGAIDALRIQQAAVRVAISDRKTATRGMPAIMEAGTVIVKTLDNLILAFKAEHPQFIAGYQNARKIIRTGIRHKDDEAPGNAVADAS